MLPAHLTRRQLFWLINCSKANFSMVCNGNHVPICERPIVKYSNATTIFQDRQLFRSFWHSRPIQNSSDNSSTNKSMENDQSIASQFTTERQEKVEEFTTESGKAEEEAIDAKPEGTKEQQGDRWIKTATPESNEPILLASRHLRYGRPMGWFYIHYRMGKSGRKFLAISCKSGTQGIFDNYPNIVVPEDVFAFVRAMDELVEAVETNRDKIEAYQGDQEVVLHTAKAKGILNDFELDLCLDQSLYVNMRTVPNERGPWHRQKENFLLPMQFFCWMRHAIGDMFVESGEPEVQQQFGEAPSLPNLDKIVVFRSVPDR